jgi:glycosyltransferase involved in cell wall biosynthesis
LRPPSLLINRGQAGMKYCVIIPTYNNGKTLEGVISEVLKITTDVIVVNDGSTDNTSLILQKFDSMKILSYAVNKGKGYAIRKGFETAIAEGYHYAITIDSDGQHYAGDIPVFIQKIQEAPDSIIVGARNLVRENISEASSFANRFSNFWYRFLTGITLPDTQSGYRLYPLESLKEMRFYTRKYEFELEILVRAAWEDIKITSVPIRVYYPPENERVSHFRPFRDFTRISVLNTLFVIMALLYIKPFSFLKYLTRENIRNFVNKHILLTNETNLKIALAVAFGVFMGIVPIWGLQLIIAIALAHVFKLSKFIVIVAANISIPPMIPFILYASYLTGGIIIRTGTNIRFSDELTVRSFENNLLQYIAGSIVFAVIMGIVAGIASFIIVTWIRKKPAKEN